jgi:hypothetical protein
MQKRTTAIRGFVRFMRTAMQVSDTLARIAENSKRTAQTSSPARVLAANAMDAWRDALQGDASTAAIGVTRLRDQTT